MKRWPAGLQLLLSVPQAEAIGSWLGSSTSAVACLGGEQTYRKKPATKFPRTCVCKGFASEQRHAGGDGSWQCKGERRCPRREQTLLLARPGEGYALCCGSAALRDCGGGKADLRKEEVMLKMSLGVDILQSRHTVKITESLVGKDL